MHGFVPFVVGWVSIAIGEEIFFRGFLQRQLTMKARHGPAPTMTAIFVASAAFALAHAPRLLLQKQPVVSNMLTWLAIGVVLGALYHTTGNLLICVGVHALLNWPVLVFDEALNHTLAVTVVAVAYMAIVLVRSGHKSLGVRPTRALDEHRH
jgi:membrane protease YdiL (CAAX protease family)